MLSICCYLESTLYTLFILMFVSFHIFNVLLYLPTPGWFQPITCPMQETMALKILLMSNAGNNVPKNIINVQCRKQCPYKYYQKHQIKKG